MHTAARLTELIQERIAGLTKPELATLIWRGKTRIQELKRKKRTEDEQDELDRLVNLQKLLEANAARRG